MSAVKAYVSTWPLEKIMEHVTASVYEEFMDRSKPRVRVDLRTGVKPNEIQYFTLPR
jgi:hypothetical protein